MATKVFTNIDLTGNALQSLPNVYDNQAFDLTTAQDKLIDLLTFVLVDHASGPGWTKPYTGTNKAVFRPSVGNQHYFRVDETDNSYYADVRSFEAMTDVDTGDNETPSSGTTSRWYKGGSSGSSENDWFIICDEQALFFGLRAVDYTAADEIFLVSGWGDSIPHDPASEYLTFIYSSDSTSSTLFTAAATPLTGVPAGNVTGNMQLLRGYENLGSSVEFTHGPQFYTGGTIYLTGGTGAPAAPSPVSGEIDLAGVEIFEDLAGDETAVAELPGVMSPRHGNTNTYLIPEYFNLLSGSGDFAGQNFLCVTSGTAGSADGNQGPLIFKLGDWR